MHHSGAFLSACIATSYWISTAHAKSGALWCGTLMCVDAVIRGNTVSYEMKALNQLGWMSIGFGSSMNNTPIVVMWPNEDGTVTLSQRLATGHVEPQPDPKPSRVATVSTHMDISSDISPILSFDMPNNGGTVESLIWAFGVTSPNSTDPSAHIVQHLDAGSFSLDLSKTNSGGDDDGDDDDKTSSSNLPTSATSTPSSSASSSLSSMQTDTPSSSHSSSSSSASSSPSTHPSAAPAQSSPPQQSHHTILVAHAVLCFLGFSLLLPLAAVIARWGRTMTHHWFRAHWITIVVLGLPTMLPGWILGPVLVSRERHKHVVNDHQIVGVVLFVLCLLQMSVGTFLRLRSPPNPKKAHPPQNVVHVLLGLVIIGLALFETFTGIAQTWTLSSTTKEALTIGCAIWTTAVVVAYLSGLIRLRRQFDQERLGWHLPVSSRSMSLVTESPASHAAAPLRRAFPSQRRSPPPWEDSDDDIDAIFRHISSSGPTSQAETRTQSIVEMRELQGPLPISVRY